MTSTSYLQEFLEQRKDIILNLGFHSSSWEGLKKYVDFLWVSNEELNLVSRKMTEEELVDNHIIDCLLPLKKFPKEARVVADFGSGGGLPAVIYALQWPGVEFLLYEKSPKKQKFLESCQSFAPNLVVQSEIPKRLGAVDLVTARGFKPLDVILDFSRDYYKAGGRYFLLKARLEKINEEISLAQKKFKELKVLVSPLASPVLEVERHLVEIG